MAPEVRNFIKNPETNFDEFKSDIYSFACLVYVLVFKSLPYKNRLHKQDEIYEKIVNKDKVAFINHLKSLKDTNNLDDLTVE